MQGIKTAPALLPQDEGLRASLPAHRAPGGLVVREAKPWYRKSNDAWYVEVGGKQVRLAKGKANRAEAVSQFHLLMAGIKPVQVRNPSRRARSATSSLRHSEREHDARDVRVAQALPPELLRPLRPPEGRGPDSVPPHGLARRAPQLEGGSPARDRR